MKNIFLAGNLYQNGNSLNNHLIRGFKCLNCKPNNLHFILNCNQKYHSFMASNPKIYHNREIILRKYFKIFIFYLLFHINFDFNKKNIRLENINIALQIHQKTWDNYLQDNILLNHFIRYLHIFCNNFLKLDFTYLLNMHFLNFLNNYHPQYMKLKFLIFSNNPNFHIKSKQVCIIESHTLFINPNILDFINIIIRILNNFHNHLYYNLKNILK